MTAVRRVEQPQMRSDVRRAVAVRCVRTIALLSMLACSSGRESVSPASEARVAISLADRVPAINLLTVPSQHPGLQELHGFTSAEIDPFGHKYAWQTSTRASLVVSVERPDVDHELRVRARPFVPANIRRQLLTPIVNGQPLTPRVVIGEDEELSWRVPSSLVLSGSNEVVLEAEYALVASAVRPGSTDDRTLAMRNYGTIFAPLPRPLDQAFLVPQFSSVSIPIRGGPEPHLSIARVSSPNGGSGSLRLFLSVDGPVEQTATHREVGVIELSSEPVELDFELPLGPDETAFLQLEPRGATSFLVEQPVLSWNEAQGGAEVARGPRPRIIVLYLSDATRADRLSVFGYGRPTTPFLERLVAGDAVAWPITSSCSWTRPATATLLTGLLEGAHGVETHNDSLPPEAPYLPEVLSQGGYRTVAFSANSNVQESTGFGRGFQRFEDVSEPFQDGEMKPRIEHYLDDVLGAVDALDPDEQLFLFIHSMGPHDPYQPPADAIEALGITSVPKLDGESLAVGPAQLSWVNEAAKKDIELDNGILGGLSDLYDAEILAEDVWVEELVAGLQERGVWDETLFVFTADHGEEFGEHDGLRHGETLFEEQLRVPLVVAAPDGWSLEELSPAHLTDLAPTIASMAGADYPPSQGRDLLVSAGRRLLHAELTPEQMASVQDRRMKLISSENAAPRLYDLDRDPQELANVRHLYRAHAALLDLEIAAREREDAEYRERFTRVEAVLTEAQRRRLEALGYLE